MSVDQNMHTIIGFLFTKKDIEAAFKKEIAPEKFRMEKVFSSKTGERLADKKIVIEEAQEVWSFGNKDYGWDDDLFEGLCRHLSKVTGLSVKYCNHEDENICIFGVQFGKLQDHGGRCWSGLISLSQDELNKLFATVQPIGDRLADLGLKKVEAKIHVVAYIC